MGIFDRVLRAGEGKKLRALAGLVPDVNALEPEFHACQGGVTKDFYNPRNSTWGEPPQLDWLDPTTGLVSFSIGGNDSKFADVLAECALGMELLPFNTCAYALTLCAGGRRSCIPRFTARR